MNSFYSSLLRSEGCHRDIFCKVENTTCSASLRSRDDMEEQISHKKVSGCDGKTFQCKQCGKCFHHVGNLRKHERLHTEEGTLNCNQCGKVFSREETLKQHNRTHSGEKPFKCNHCGKCFRNSGNFTSHKRTHHTVEGITAKKDDNCFRISELLSTIKVIKQEQWNLSTYSENEFGGMQQL